MRPYLMRMYYRHREWPVFGALRSMRDFVVEKANVPLQRRFIRWACDAVYETRPLESNPSASVEVHTLVCHRHLPMYLTAVKSLMQFGVDFAVVVHDDGSLTHNDTAVLEAHIKGIRIIPKSAADREMMAVLKNRPYSLRFRLGEVVSLQLFDFAHFAKTSKILAVDSDTLFLERPQRLLDWASGRQREILHLYEQHPASQKEFLTKVGCPYPPHFCMGLVAYYRELVDLDVVERTLKLAGNFDWFSSQNIFPVLIHAQLPGSNGYFLDSREYQDIWNTVQPGTVFRHYWSSGFTTLKHARQTYVEDTRRFYSAMGVTRYKPTDAILAAWSAIPERLFAAFRS